MQVVPEKVLPPTELLFDCPAPILRLASNGELANSLMLSMNALTLCNKDKAALREWAYGEEQ